ncbi:aspartate/glutamate racemase family protein [Oricola sp.]|uniref:aspartate/glutamate racemase family protein n=1 Tax=Oricola sp. TaxID=1979950 RepID=UPI0025E93E0E|nr:aspartate/glutamate racemase family protein [Oricola sp.]MCI5078226.1 aspartate/glutamate racemase family protein [Oricola sp.]
MLESAKTRDCRLLVINPNTNPGVTRRIAEHMAQHAADATVEVVNPASGPFSIETAADRDCAVPAVLDLIRANPGHDGYILACFDDIAVDEARALVDAPVISMAQAAIEAAAATGGPYTIVTTVEDQVPTIEALMRRYDPGQAGTVRACRVGVAAASARSAEAESLLDRHIRAAIADDGAGTVVLGSGAYVGRAGDLEKRYGIRFIEGLMAAAERLARQR